MQTTSQNWRELWAAGAPLEARATVNGTVYEGVAPEINRAAMQDSLSVGNVVAASMLLSLRGAASVPRSAAVAVEVRLNDGETASEWLPQGTFYISRRARDPVTGVLALECYDALLKANALWEPSAGDWPRAMSAVVAELAALLGLTLDSRTAIPSGAAYTISEPAAGTTIRDVLGTVAQAAGGGWVVTPEDRLRLVPLLDASGAAEATTDAVDVDGVVGGMDVGQAGAVTGVRDSWEGDVYLTGDDTGIVVDVSLPPVIAAELADALVGIGYQPFSLSGAVVDPAIEIGDCVRAGAGGEVASVLYSARMLLGPACRGDLAAPQPGELTDEYPYIGGRDRTLALARAAATQAVEALDDELTQQEIFNRLTDNGAAQGLVLLNGQLYVNASYIRSGTLVLGGQNNQNGTLQVLDANGNVVGTWDNNGVEIKSGAINANAPGGYVAINAEVFPQFRRALSVLYGSGSDQVLFMVDRGELNLWQGSFGDGVTTDRTTDIIPGAINMFGYLCGMSITGTANYPGSEPGLVDVDNSSTRYRNGLIEIKDRNNAIWFRVNYEGMNFRGPVTFGDSLDIAGALSVGDAATTRANLGITPANIGALPDTTTAADIGALPDTTTAADIGASAAFGLTGDYTTAATIYSVLNTMARGSVATIVTRAAASNAMCGVNYDMYGTIWRNPTSTSNNYYLSMTRTSGLEQYCYVLTLTDSSMSHGTVYKYTGTAV